MSVLPTIGLEVHVQLATETKLFCGCPTTFAAPPNTAVCPVCAGFPGVLPVLNRRAVELAIRTALGLGCEILPRTKFDRKNYFYPDLPKDYQISQYDLPFSRNGRLEVDIPHGPGGGTKVVRITRAHVEEDAGKSLHDRRPAETCVDLNRCGVPLMEIVSEPDLESPDEAHAYLAELKRLLLALGVSDCTMEEGSLRCDANVSVRPAGTTALGTKVEVKNLNTFKGVKRALEHEIARQSAALARGERIAQETRLWDEGRGVTAPMRSKEEAHDYRYFPEPDLPALEVPRAWVEEARRALPESPRARRGRFVSAHGLPASDAAVLTEEPAVADFFEALAREIGEAKAAANWVMGEMLARAKDAPGGFRALRVTPAAVGDLHRRVRGGAISANQAKEVLAEMAATGRAAAEVIAARGLAQVSDEATLAGAVASVLAENPGSVADYRAGKGAKAIGFLMGRIMKATGGRANPNRAREILEAELRGRAGA
ncbi:MAG: Asp-tRNA(Asn)/Glu-tRNA(Gln) amidotransferase subunit GatB [Planctomycetales bacterium]|nr:Asp-tRNA(Asn)/Glu-tRNA(Gln) amidotransferase subunit GatB [Planctomycetales bacterium]